MRALNSRRGNLTSVVIACMLLGGFAVSAVSAGADGTQPQAIDPSLTQRCTALAELDFSTIADAPAQVSNATLVTRSDELFEGLANITSAEFVAFAKTQFATIKPYCRVFGYVLPSAGFELLLPVNHWNGKFLHVGCGGWCGSTGVVGLYCASHPDYACIGTDMGHSGAGGLWFRNNLQAQVNFAYLATHVVTLAGKAITQRYYGSEPRQAYFMGCSTGGSQGLVEAQHYPLDFNGIVAGSPGMDAARWIWIRQSIMGKDGKPVLASKELALLHQAALAQCDLDDGLKDGIISDPAHCRFDPKTMQCPIGKTENCLTPQQVRAASNVYGVPATSAGVQLSFYGRGLLPGSEERWSEFFSETWGDTFFKDTALLTVPGKTWTFGDFDFDRDYARTGVGVLFPENNPDLRAFKGAGGKLISYEGGNDAQGAIPGFIVDYFETVERTMGGAAATQEFFRFFLVPGMNHCTEGEGPFAIDYLSYLESWVERAQPPRFMVGAHIDDLPLQGGYALKVPLNPDASVTFTRPIYPYPSHAIYVRKGNPNRWENYREEKFVAPVAKTAQSGGQ